MLRCVALRCVETVQQYTAQFQWNFAMIISVVNASNGRVSDRDLLFVIRAVNRQIADDFVPYWGMPATLRLEGYSKRSEQYEQPKELRGEAIIYVLTEDSGSKLGMHDRTKSGIPIGFVYVQDGNSIGDWSVTLSHEALELIADPYCNLLVMGPHPHNPDVNVFHWYEMCDPVQGHTYEIDGVAVSDFVLPLYFTVEHEPGSRNDFLGLPLKSFGVANGGYIGYYNPATREFEYYYVDAAGRAVKEQMRGLPLKRPSRRMAGSISDQPASLTKVLSCSCHHSPDCDRYVGTRYGGD